MGGRFSIGKDRSGATVDDGGVGVEVVIDMDPVDIIAFDDIHDNGEGALSGEGGGGVHPAVVFEGAYDGGVGAGDVVPGGGDVFVREGAKWIEPGVDFDAAGMGLGDAVGERIVAWRAAHGT